MQLLAFALLPPVIWGAAEMLVLALGHLMGRWDGRKPFSRLISYAIGMGAFCLALATTFLTQLLAVPAIEPHITPAGAFVVSIIDIPIVAAFAGVATLAMWQKYGDPDQAWEQERTAGIEYIARTTEELRAQP